MSRLLAAVALCLAPLCAFAEVKVLTSIKPLQLIAAALQDGVGTPDVLLPAGASAHHYNLRPSDVRQLRSADVVYWVGDDLETFLTKPLAARSGLTVAVQHLPALHLRHFGDTSEHEHEHEHEHDHAHRPGSLDAHLWLDVGNAQRIAKQMAEDFAALDPTNAARYQTNLAAFTLRVATLDKALKAELAPLAGKPYFVFHEAFDYFESRYGLKHAGVFSVSSEVMPGARHVAQMRERLQSQGASCVFSEPPLVPKLANTLSQGLPVTLAEADAMGSLQKVDKHGYENLLKALATSFSQCLTPL